MKNIVIIEDNFLHFQIIGKLIKSHDINIFPNGINSDKELCDFLNPIRALIETTDANTRENRITEFFNNMHIAQDQISIYIVDFQLLADSADINGLKFCEYINDIREGKVPAIILTISDLNQVDVLKQRTDFVNKFTKSKIEFDRKVQNKTGKKIKNWDQQGQNINAIIINSSDLSDRLKGTIDRLCNGNKEEGENYDDPERA